VLLVSILAVGAALCLIARTIDARMRRSAATVAANF